MCIFATATSEGGRGRSLEYRRELGKRIYKTARLRVMIYSNKTLPMYS